jgi:YceI-like domain
MTYRTVSRVASPRTAAILLAFTVSVVVARPTAAQSVTLTIDRQLSLAWWQINPHLNHLWATTCPGDPSWRPGEGTSIAQARSILTRVHARRGYSAILDTIVPLYPRRAARPVCSDAVSGQLVADDTVTWRGVRGWIVIRVDALETGLKMRDDFARRNIFQVSKYPEIKFRIDSLTAAQPGDTIRARAVGVLEVRGVQEPLSIPIKGWYEAGGLRVTGHADVPARNITQKYNVSRWAIGLGVGTAIWETLHMGVDVVLKPGALVR